MQDDLAARYISERPLNYIVDWESTLSQARDWLTACVNRYPTHARCSPEWQVGRRYSDFVPTRLVEVKRHIDGNLWTRIVQYDPQQQGNSGKIEWACLSYCWGGDQVTKTTRANLAARRTVLSFADLPQTLKDALHVTYRLNLQFIWIDALCIDQDDPDDVSHEIAAMPDIYKGGICTITASRASGSKEGFMQDHEVEAIHHEPICINVACPNGQPGHVNLGPRGAEYRNAPDPIHKRAWCFQERILSTRVLDFGYTQTRWTCLSGSYVDGGNAELAARTDPRIGRSLQTLTRERLLETWQDLVDSYTKRDLTFTGDKLLAISAIASEFAPHMRSDYLAGLWRHSLPHSLDWRSGRYKYSRPSFYVAPSW